MAEPLGDQLVDVSLPGIRNDNVFLFGQRNVKNTWDTGNFKAEPVYDVFYVPTISASVRKTLTDAGLSE